MKNPSELMYTASHEWVKFVDDTTAYVGLTDFAQGALGDIVYANLPSVLDCVEADAPMGDIESIKTVSDIISPVTGEVADINEEALDNPGQINADPYETWLVKITDITARAALMNAEEYEALCEKEA